MMPRLRTPSTLQLAAAAYRLEGVSGVARRAVRRLKLVRGRVLARLRP